MKFIELKSLIGNNCINTQSDSFAGLECYLSERKLTSFFMKWDTMSLNLYLEFSSSDKAAIERSMYVSLGREIPAIQRKEELAQIQKTRQETMETIWSILTMRDIYLFVELKQPQDTEKKKMMLPLRELDQFTTTIDPRSELTWWPSHFTTQEEAIKWSTERLNLL